MNWIGDDMSAELGVKRLPNIVTHHLSTQNKSQPIITVIDPFLVHIMQADFKTALCFGIVPTFVSYYASKEWGHTRSRIEVDDDIES
jgi:hypothetical protein